MGDIGMEKDRVSEFPLGPDGITWKWGDDAMWLLRLVIKRMVSVWLVGCLSDYLLPGETTTKLWGPSRCLCGKNWGSSQLARTRLPGRPVSYLGRDCPAPAELLNDCSSGQGFDHNARGSLSPNHPVSCSWIPGWGRVRGLSSARVHLLNPRAFGCKLHTSGHDQLASRDPVFYPLGNPLPSLAGGKGHWSRSDCFLYEYSATPPYLSLILYLDVKK